MLVLVLNSGSSSIACWGFLHNPPHAAHGMSTVVQNPHPLNAVVLEWVIGLVP